MSYGKGDSDKKGDDLYLMRVWFGKIERTKKTEK